MGTISSKYNDEITSKNDFLSQIDSKTENKISSITHFVLNSKVMSVPGASDIVAMVGAFSKCNVSDWKTAKGVALRRRI